jgi:hypothetical protein
MAHGVRVVSVVGAAVLSLIAAGTVAAGGPRPAGMSVTIAGGTSAQRQLARLTALRVGGVTVRRVAFRAPSRVLRHEHLHGAELVVSSAGKETLRADWEQELFVGTYLGLMARWPKAAVVAAATNHTEGPAARLQTLDVFGSNPRASSVQRQVTAFVNRATASGAKVIEFRTIATPARAMAITLRVGDPAAFLKHRTRALLDLLNKPRVPLLGFYLGIEDESGQLVWATSRLPNTGGVFTIPRLDACSPVTHSEPLGHAPPPCPAH